MNTKRTPKQNQKKLLRKVQPVQRVSYKKPKHKVAALSSVRPLGRPWWKFWVPKTVYIVTTMELPS